MIAGAPDGRGAPHDHGRTLKSDASLRESAWIEGNRARVRSRSNGTLAYVYIPNFQERGMAAVLRQWTAASDKDGVVIDQRYNPGGWAADFILDLVSRRPLSYYEFRDARDLPFPVVSNAGPRALLVNERNGSAAETFPGSSSDPESARSWDDERRDGASGTSGTTRLRTAAGSPCRSAPSSTRMAAGTSRITASPPTSPWRSIPQGPCVARMRSWRRPSMPCLRGGRNTRPRRRAIRHP
jgi:hypothetical protein